jgi:hypothetical protein
MSTIDPLGYPLFPLFYFSNFRAKSILFFAFFSLFLGTLTSQYKNTAMKALKMMNDHKMPKFLYRCEYEEENSLKN